MQGMGILALAGGALAGIAFAFIVVPIWTMVDAAASGKRLTAKGLWITAIMLAGPLASFAYGLFATQSRRLKWSCLGSAVFSVALIGAVILGMPWVIQQTKRQLGHLTTVLDQANLLGVSPEGRRVLAEALRTLQTEMEGHWLSNLERVQRALGLHELLTASLQDGQLTEREHREWMATFEARRSLDREVIRRRARAARKGS